jgi:RNA polymerase sigma-70 factor (ECF subfamily)
MSAPPPDAVRWLPAAQAGSQQALGKLLDACRGYLLVIAGQELDPALRAKGGASDLVQETLLEACRDFQHFRGNSEQELFAWLRRLLLNNLSNFTRRYRDTAKRRAGAEIPLQGSASSSGEGVGLADAQKTPSRQAIADEQARSLQRALERLPADYRQVILLRYQDELPFEEIGRLMERSSNAAEKLWLRAIERLRQELENPR